jgi:DNA-binding NarL/FixJ family response regulator
MQPSKEKPMRLPEERSEIGERLAVKLARSSTRRRIVHLLLEGKTRKEIAAIMGRSPHTIDSHIRVLYRAVGFGDRAQLMMLAQKLLDSGFIPSPKPGTVRRPECGEYCNEDLSR